MNVRNCGNCVHLLNAKEDPENNRMKFCPVVQLMVFTDDEVAKDCASFSPVWEEE